MKKLILCVALVALSVPSTASAAALIPTVEEHDTLKRINSGEIPIAHVTALLRNQSAEYSKLDQSPTCGPCGCTEKSKVMVWHGGAWHPWGETKAAHCGRHFHPLRTAARVFWRTSPFYVFGHGGCHK